MFYYYCSFYLKNFKIKNYKILNLINFILFVKSNVKVKEKYHLKHYIYFFFKNKYIDLNMFFKKYLSVYLKRLKKNCYEKINKNKFFYLCKKKKLSRKLKYIKNKKKRKFKFV